MTARLARLHRQSAVAAGGAGAVAGAVAVASFAAALVAWLAAPATVLAHGPVPAEPPSVANILFGWSFEPLVLLPLVGSAVAWMLAVRRVNAAHPATPVPRSRTLAFLGGLFAIAFALQSGIDRYDTALFSIHMVQHVLFILTALLFWWPAVARDPAPWRMPHPGRVMYVFLQMPQNTFLAVVILFASAPLYSHYATLNRPWGPSALVDQQLAGAVMWLAGDVLFIAAIIAIVAGWMRFEERDSARADRRAATEEAAIRTREAALAERLAEQQEQRQGG